MATPVWFVEAGGRLLVETDAASYKVRRIRRDPRVTIAPCTATGRLRGIPVPARAELLPDAEVAHVEQLMAHKYRVDLLVIKPFRACSLPCTGIGLAKPRSSWSSRRRDRRPRIVLRARTAAEPQTLSAAYERCRQLHARHGRTYYLATWLLPRWKRRHVHALYGFTRYADEIVDHPTSTLDRTGQTAALHTWGDRLFAALRGAPCQDPVLPAVVHTVRAFDLDPGDFQRFLAAMAMDLTVDGYQTYQELCGYMEGSAAVIGTMLTPILESSDPPAARAHARQLGLAFQLTNFIRDITEDYRRGRVYLPAEDLDRFGVHRADLAAPTASPAVAELVAFEVERARGHYRAAAPGIALLAPSSRPCIQVAFELYGAILEEVERAGYQVLDRRIRVPRHRRLTVAGQHWVAARSAARAEHRVSITTS